MNLQIAQHEKYLPPVAFICGAILSQVGGMVPFFVWLNGMIFHESGHAVIYWLRGIPAIPSFGATVTFSCSYVWWFFLILFGAAIFALKKCLDRDWMVLASLSGGSALLMLVFTFFLSNQTADQIAIFGGQGGEILLAAFAVGSFYFPWRTSQQAQQIRYFLLFSGALCFSAAFFKWRSIAAGTQDLPLGALFDPGAWGGGESGGDMDRLIRDFGWTKGRIISAYSRTAWLSLVGLAFWYASQIRKWAGDKAPTMKP